MLFPSTLSRYILGHFLKWFVALHVIFTAFILLFDFMEFMRKSSGKIFISFKIILQMMFLKLPMFLQQLLPFIVLFSTILTFWHLNRFHELEIIRTSQRSLIQILRPLILLILSFGVFDLTILNTVSSKMMLQYEHLHNCHFRGNSGSLAVVDSGLWLRQVDQDVQTVIHIRHIQAKEQYLQNISIFKYNDKDQFLTRVDAKSAVFESGYLVLKDVWVFEPDVVPKKLDQYTLKTALTFLSIQNQGADPQSLPFWQIQDYIVLLINSGLSPIKYRLHYHFLITRVFWLEIMMIIGVLCSLRPPRQQKTILLLTGSLFIAFFVYFLKDITYALGTAGRLPVPLATWLPIIIGSFLSISALLYCEEK